MLTKYVQPLFFLKLTCLLLMLSTILSKANYNKSSDSSEKLLSSTEVDSIVVKYSESFDSNSKIEIEKASEYIKLGQIYKSKQLYARSLQCYQKAIHVFQKYHLFDLEFYVYTQLAELYRYRRLYPQAQNYLKICENILQRRKINEAYLMEYYSRKAAMFAEYENKNDSALVYSQKSLALSRRLGDYQTELISLMEIAGLYESQKDYTKSIEQLYTIIDLARKKSKKQIECDALVNLSRNLISVKNYDKSIQTALKGFKLAEVNKLSYNQLLFADNLQSAYEKSGQYKSAYKYLRIRLKLTEDYYNRLYDEKVLDYEEKFKMAEKEKIIGKNKKLLEIKEEEIKRQNLINYFILIGLVGFVVFAGIQIYYIKIIKKQNKALAFASEQNDFLVSETHHRVNNNLQLVRILIENELNKNPNIDSLSSDRILVKIDSMGILHRNLYRNQNKSIMDLKDFLLEIHQNLNFLFEEHRINSRFEIDPVTTPINTAMYIGLLVTELCINSIKHAFPSTENKKIELKLHYIDKKIYFHYQDNGQTKEEITKLDLIEKLCRQLKIDFKISTESGFKFSFNMKLA